MSNYTQNVFFAPKDSLTAGDANKKIKGSEVDAELAEISTCITSKEDTANKGAANGYASLGSDGLVPQAQLPVASETVSGRVELATSAEATTGTDTVRAVTPAGVKAVIDALRAANSGAIGDLEGLVDPNADRLVFWDDSAGAFVFLTVGTGLQIVTTTLSTNDAQIVHDSLSGFVANEHIDHTTVTLTAGNGLTGGGDISANRSFAVGAGAGISVSADAVALDLDTIATAVEGNAIVSTDEFPVNDGGTTKYMTAAGAGVPVDSTASTAITLATADMNRAKYMTAGTAITVTLNTSVGVVGNFVVLIQAGAGQATVSGTATINSANGLKTRVQYSVVLLLCVAANTWIMYGDTTT